MATSNQATWENMATKLMSMGGIVHAVIGEPKKAMQSGTVAIIPTRGSIPETTLTHARETHFVMLRRYHNAMTEPADQIEFLLDQWRADIMEDVFGDFDLGGTIAYAWPTQFEWSYGYQTIDQTVYRLLDLTVAYYVDDRSAFAA